MAFEAARQRWEKEEVAPTMSRRADEAGQRDAPILELAQVVRQPHASQQVARGFLVKEPADLLGDEIGVGAWRLIAFVAPLLVGGAGLSLADELQRLGAWFVTEGLAL